MGFYALVFFLLLFFWMVFSIPSFVRSARLYALSKKAGLNYSRVGPSKNPIWNLNFFAPLTKNLISGEYQGRSISIKDMTRISGGLPRFQRAYRLTEINGKVYGRLSVSVIRGFIYSNESLETHKFSNFGKISFGMYYIGTLAAGFIVYAIIQFYEAHIIYKALLSIAVLVFFITAGHFLAKHNRYIKLEKNEMEVD